MNNKNLGRTGKDVITGFSGLIIGFVEYFTGCNQYLIVPKCANTSDKPESHWFDSSRIEVSGEKIKLVDETEPDGPDKMPNKI